MFPRTWYLTLGGTSYSIEYSSSGIPSTPEELGHTEREWQSLRCQLLRRTREPHRTFSQIRDEIVGMGELLRWRDDFDGFGSFRGQHDSRNRYPLTGAWEDEHEFGGSIIGRGELDGDVEGAIRSGKLVIRRDMLRDYPPECFKSAPKAPPQESAQQPEIDRPKPPLVEAEPQRHTVLDKVYWIGLQLVDQNDQPVVDKGYCVVSSDGAEHRGKLDKEGKGYLGDLPSGDCKVGFSDLDGKEWGATNNDNPEGETYTVEAGDHISAIASKAGFECDDTIWMHAKNADLRKVRDNPHVLLEGDSLFVPKKREMTVGRAAELTHKFVAKRTPLTIRLRLQDAFGEPVANASGSLEHAGGKLEVTTDGDGILEAQVPKNTTTATVVIPSENLSLELGIGELDPTSEESGLSGRLHNLCYNPGYEAMNALTFKDQLASALEFFEDDSGQVATGDLSHDWTQEMEPEYGC